MMLRTRLPLNASTNLMVDAAWEATPRLRLNVATMVPRAWGKSSWGWQEGNAFEMPEGGVANLLRIDGQTAATHNKAALVRVAPVGGGTGSPFRLQFDRMIDFPSTSSKFVVRRAPPPSRAYYTLSTSVTAGAVRRGAVYARNHLVLATSTDAIHWATCYTLLTDDTGLSPEDSARLTGFHYVDWVFDGDDIIYAVRTAYRGANSYHNANRLTTKRVLKYAETCERGLHWQSGYTRVGDGWCRPAAAYQPADGGEAADARECAQRCDEWQRCQGFAMNATMCALYLQMPNASSGAGGFSCWRRGHVG